jgi:hypothetical protein
MGDSRPLGEQERLLNYMNTFSGLMPLGVMHIRGPLDAEMVERALAWLQRRHPVLRAHIRYGELVWTNVPPYAYRQPYFETEGTLPIEFREVAGDWREIMEQELNKPLPKGKRPRVRVTLVPDRTDPELNHLMFCADHACMDAPAAQIMNRELMEYFADPAKMEALPPTYATLPPPLEAGMPKKSSSGTKGYEPALRLPRLKTKWWKRGTGVLSRRLGSAETNALKEAVKLNRTTMHGVITGSFLLAMHQRYGVAAMTVLNSFELRRMCRPQLPMDTFGCYIDIVRTRHDLGPDLWAIARDVSFRLIATVAKDQEAASLLKQPGWDVYKHETWPMITHNQRLDGLGITTAGESGLKETYGNHTLEGMTAAVSLDFMGPSLLVLAAERAGGLDLYMSYAINALPREDADALADDAVAALTAAGALAAATRQTGLQDG